MDKYTDVLFPLDNGGRPFMVTITEDGLVSVYKNNDRLLKTKTLTKQDRPIFEIQAENVMIGTDEEHGEYADGNSILIHAEGNLYYYIGWKVEEFTTKAEIVDYKSPVGNSSVPYPYAVDSEGNYYLMVEHVMLKPTKLLKNFLLEDEENDPYHFYYDHQKSHGVVKYEVVTKGVRRFDY